MIQKKGARSLISLPTENINEPALQFFSSADFIRPLIL